MQFINTEIYWLKSTINPDEAPKGLELCVLQPSANGASHFKQTAYDKHFDGHFVRVPFSPLNHFRLSIIPPKAFFSKYLLRSIFILLRWTFDIYCLVYMYMTSAQCSPLTDGRFGRDPLLVSSAADHCEQFRHGQGCALFDVVHPAFPLPTTASPASQGALKDVF